MAIFIQWSRTNCAVMVKGIMRNISVIFYSFGLEVQEKMSRFLIWSSASPFVRQQNDLCNFGRGHNEHLCEIILYLDQWSFKDISYLELWQLLFGAA